MTSDKTGADKTGAFQRLKDRTQPQEKAEAWAQLRKERLEAQRQMALTIVEALVRRGGRAAPEPLRLDARATPYLFKGAMDQLQLEGIVERAKDGSWRGGDWRLTDRTREKLAAAGRPLPPELTPRERQAAALAERVLDGLRGESHALPPVLSLRFLRTHIGCSWDALSLALDALERDGKVQRVWQGARLRGYRLAVAEKAIAETAQAVAPALVEATEDPRTAARIRLTNEVLDALSRAPGPMVIAEIRNATHAGPAILKEILDGLAASGEAKQLWHGARSAGWTVTDLGRRAAPADNLPKMVGWMTSRELHARVDAERAAAAEPAPAPNSLAAILARQSP